MQSSHTPPEVLLTSDDYKQAEGEIITLIESMSESHKFNAQNPENEFTPNFSPDILDLVITVFLIMFFFKSPKADYLWDLGHVVVFLFCTVGFIVLMVVVRLTLTAGQWVSHKLSLFFRQETINVEVVKHTKISDTDLEILAANRFIKEWLLEALGKNDTLTYFLIHKERFKISHKARAEVVVAEKKRIRTLIGG